LPQLKLNLNGARALRGRHSAKFLQDFCSFRLRSKERFSIPGDEFLDRHRLAATYISDIIVGAGENAVTVIDRNLLQMLDDKRLSRIGAECTGITIKGRRGVSTRLIRTGEAKFRELFDWHILVFDLLAQNLTDDRRDFRLR